MHATAREGREHSQSMGASIDLPPRVQLSENLLTKHGQQLPHKDHLDRTLHLTTFP